MHRQRLAEAVGWPPEVGQSLAPPSARCDVLQEDVVGPPRSILNRLPLVGNRHGCLGAEIQNERSEALLEAKELWVPGTC